MSNENSYAPAAQEGDDLVTARAWLRKRWGVSHPNEAHVKQLAEYGTARIEQLSRALAEAEARAEKAEKALAFAMAAHECRDIDQETIAGWQRKRLEDANARAEAAMTALRRIIAFSEPHKDAPTYTQPHLQAVIDAVKEIARAALAAGQAKDGGEWES